VIDLLVTRPLSGTFWRASEVCRSKLNQDRHRPASGGSRLLADSSPDLCEFILAVCVVATPAGAANYREIGSHAADMPQELLKKLEAKWSWFKLRYNYPSKSAIRYVLIRIDAAVLDAITCAWISTQADRDDDKGEWVIAIDGKVLRGAWTDENDKVTLFSVMLHDEAVTVAQVRVPDGTNEITQAEAILEAAQIPAGPRVSPQPRGGANPLEKENAIKETTQWVNRDLSRALKFMTT